jgi:hypothetical protein
LFIYREGGRRFDTKPMEEIVHMPYLKQFDDLKNGFVDKLHIFLLTL